MTREIKVRAWDGNRKFMVYQEMASETYFFTISEDGILSCGTSLDGTTDWYELELLEYTGLLDKNGKEIYEGDIVEFEGTTICGQTHYERQLIKYEEFYMSNDYSRLDGIGFSTDNNFEDTVVIGNIYENPELLEEKRKDDE